MAVTAPRKDLRKVEEHKEDLMRWLLTYADMITLILLFFIILYSLSKLDTAKYKEISKVMESVFSGKPLGVMQTTTVGGKGFMSDRGFYTPQRATRGYQSKIYLQFIAALKDYISSGYARVVSNETGLVITLGSDLFFKPASADIQADGLPFLDKLSGLLMTINNNIRIEGYTDNVKIKTPRFASNWELSSQRAINILKDLEAYGVPAKRMSAVAYGDSRPQFSNDTPEGRALNRRVDIIVVMNAEETQITP